MCPSGYFEVSSAPCRLSLLGVVRRPQSRGSPNAGLAPVSRLPPPPQHSTEFWEFCRTVSHSSFSDPATSSTTFVRPHYQFFPSKMRFQKDPGHHQENPKMGNPADCTLSFFSLVFLFHWCSSCCEIPFECCPLAFQGFKGSQGKKIESSVFLRFSLEFSKRPKKRRTG